MKEPECREGKSFPSLVFIIYPSSMTNIFFMNLTNFFKYVVFMSNCFDGLQFFCDAIKGG